MLRYMFDRTIILGKRIIYRRSGEPIQYGEHKLCFIPGTRPVRLKYINDDNIVVRNDALQIKFFLDNVKTGDFCIDVGGHLGQYAVLLGALVSPLGRVITFEPNGKSRIILNKNLLLNRFHHLVEIEPLALFDKAGSHPFFIRGTDAMSSFVTSGFGSNSSVMDISEETVKTITLDDYLGARKLTFPKWIKIDCEGAEINVLKGANQVLGSDTNIICELHPYAWNEFGTTWEDLLGLVRANKKQIRYLDESVNIGNGAAYGTALITN